ncbi:MAG: 2,3-bisphosphoglycerate-independent phosphoglycerate mutase, partial [Acidaminococcaceae bacterium]
TAAIQAMETVDTCVGQIVQAILSLGGVVCITADHGNLEQMQDPVNKQPYTAHTTNKVPFVVVGLEKGRTLHSGKLADIAPTLLELLHLPKPAAMTGSSLLDQK